MQAHELDGKHAIRQRVQIVPTASDRELVQAAQRRLTEDPRDVDALFAVAAWDEIVGDLADALVLLNRLVSQKPDYPGVWWLRARVLKDLGRERDAIACERVARICAEPEMPEVVRKFPL
jgi:tetratricopeptide (TPR) repeat protein